MSKIIKLVDKIYNYISWRYNMFCRGVEKRKLGYCGKGVGIHGPMKLNKHMFLYDYTSLQGRSKFIIWEGGKFVMKARAGASMDLTVITGKHGHEVGTWARDLVKTHRLDVETTVTVEEDARLGANVTLMPGVTVGRGSQVGTCALVVEDIPPYAVAVGIPAKVIKFLFTPEQIVEHEKALYPEEERLSLEYLREIQAKYK